MSTQRPLWSTVSHTREHGQPSSEACSLASLPARGLPVSRLSPTLLPGPTAQTGPCPLLRHHGLPPPGYTSHSFPPHVVAHFPLQGPLPVPTETYQWLRPSSVGTSAWEPLLPWAGAISLPAGRLDDWLPYVSYQLTSAFTSLFPSKAAALEGGSNSSPLPPALKTHKSLQSTELIEQPLRDKESHRMSSAWQHIPFLPQITVPDGSCFSSTPAPAPPAVMLRF